MRDSVTLSHTASLESRAEAELRPPGPARQLLYGGFGMSVARSVLVVDDEPAMREMLVSMLEADGIHGVAGA